MTSPQQLGLLDIPVVRFAAGWSWDDIDQWLALHHWKLDWWESDEGCVIAHLLKEGDR